MYNKYLHSSKKCSTFAVGSPTPGFRGWEVSPLGKPTYSTKGHSRGFQDILKRRLLTLCSDTLKLRNFQICIQDLATVDVLRDIRLSLLYLLVRLLRIYTYAHAYLNYVAREYIILYSAWASRCRSNTKGNAKASKVWNDDSRTPRFFCMPILKL